MLHPIINENKRLLQFYYYGSQIIACFFLLAGAYLILMSGWLLLKGQNSSLVLEIILNVLVFKGCKLLIFGFITLGFADILKYLIHGNCKFRWMLLGLDKILYIYTAVLVAEFFFLLLSSNESIFTVYVIIKLVIIVGLAIALRRIVIPMIKEK